MARYDTNEISWGLFQHNPTTTINTPISGSKDAASITVGPIRRNKYAASITIEELAKAYVISGVQQRGFQVQDWVSYNGMLVYDFNEETWEQKGTRWGAWTMGVVNHLAFNDSSSGYILGFAGDLREVCKPYHQYGSNHLRVILCPRAAAEWT